LHFSEEVAAFSVAFLTAGWTVGSLAAVRLLRRFGEVRVAELAFLALIPPLVVGISIYGPATPIALVFAMAATLGLGIGILSQAMLNRLFRLSEPAEVGRSSSAHQYMRGLFQTYASALAGAVLLTVAKVRLGDVEPVRRILAGEVVEASEVQAAVAEGFRRAHWVPLVFTLAAAAILARSRRAERIRARSG
jgi:MFS family permease